MKPTYTVRLTGDLEPDERQRIAARVAGVTDIGADKIERLLERGMGRDLIKASSASVANRLASVLAEAGAPVQLTPVAEPVAAPAEAAESARVAPSAADDDVLRPRQSGPGREAPAPVPAEAEPRVEPERSAESQPSEATERRVEPETSEGLERGMEPEPRAVPGVDAALPEPESEAPPAAAPAPEAPPEPDVTVTPPADPGVRARPADPERDPTSRARMVEPPPRAPRARGNSAVLGAIGAAVLGVGAVFAMELLVNPIAIGILVLAILALALSLLGQRRATWLPGLGALALIVWALANAPDGTMPTLAANWQWYALFAGSLLVIVAGFQEAQRGRGP